MSRARPQLVRREAATSKTKARFEHKPFAWRERDCIRMARSHLVAMGHRKLPRLPRYDDALSAKRALKAMGAETIEQLLDALLPRIAPAAMLPGDIAIVQGSDDFDAVVICLGQKFLGFHESAEGAEVLIVHEIKAAWRA